MPFTATYANAFLNFAFSKTGNLSPSEKVYIGLCYNDPEADGGSIRELSGGGYARVLVSIRGESYPNVISTATARAISNSGQINWTKATQDWQRIKGFFLSSSAVVGETSEIFFYGKIDLTPDEEAAGGLLVEGGSVALFDPQTFKIEFADKDEKAE